MIKLTRLNGQEFVINAELIENVESRQVETVVLLSDGNRFIVKNSVDDIIDKVITYRATIKVRGEKLFKEKGE